MQQRLYGCGVAFDVRANTSRSMKTCQMSQFRMSVPQKRTSGRVTRVAFYGGKAAGPNFAA